MPDIDWKKIKAEYIRGHASYRKLADKYGVSFSTLQRRATREKWTDLRNQIEVKSDSKIVESVAEKEAKRVDVFESITDKLLAIIAQGLQDGSLVSTSRGLRDITGAIKDIREIKGIKSDADMQEQLARIEKLRKEASADATTDSEIKIILGGDLDEYAK